MIVKQLDRLALHQISGDRGGVTVTDHGFKFRDARPVAIVIEKTPFFVVVQVFGGLGAGGGHIGINARAQGVDVIGKQPFDQNHAIALVGVDMGL